ncbi:DUF222 domain-containing protein [Mycetocola zhadangensis]|uniref:HNH endonuclease signature motif containing protein n=1 Tax=Mycetocola zhadangensis TaxID=1164595 RepID=UPI003A4D4D61
MENDSEVGTAGTDRDDLSPGRAPAGAYLRPGDRDTGHRSFGDLAPEEPCPYELLADDPLPADPDPVPVGLPPLEPALRNPHPDYLAHTDVHPDDVEPDYFDPDTPAPEPGPHLDVDVPDDLDPDNVGEDWSAEPEVIPAPPTEYARGADLCTTLIDAVAEVEKLEARQAAQKAELVDRALIVALANEEGVAAMERAQTAAQRKDLAFRSFLAELACTLRISERSAQGLVNDSSELVHRLPATLTALREGEISYRHAQQLVDQISGLTDAAAAELEEHVLPFARTMTVAQFRQKTRKVRERLQPESAVERCVKSVRDRRMEMIPAADGMAWLNLYTTAPVAESLFSVIRAQSMRLQSPVEARTLPQLDADAMVGAMFESFTGEFSTPDPVGGRVFGTGLGRYRYDVEPRSATATETTTAADAGAFGPTRVTALTGLAGAVGTVVRISCTGPGAEPLDTFRKIVPTVMVTVPVLTLLGQDDEPGNLDGYGPIDPATARDLASQAPEFSRILTHPETGVALSLGQTKYKPTQAMKRFLRYRDGACRFPGCNRRAVSCDIDHTDPFGGGGGTDFDNLASLCPKHHKMKHETLWEVEQLGDGVLKWTSPQGRVYLTHPENPVRGPVPATKAGPTRPDSPDEPRTGPATDPLAESPTEPLAESPTEPLTELPTDPLTESPTEPARDDVSHDPGTPPF